MPSLVPKFVKKEITDGWVAETWKLMLLNNTHTPDAGTQQFVSDVVSKEITDTGIIPVYTAGGVAISGKASVANSNNYFLDASDVVIGPGATVNYRYGILFKDTGNQATSPIRAQIDFVTDQIVVNGTSTIQWNPVGIIYVS
jgi:hypothetical protein